jgi:hypothetical protein
MDDFGCFNESVINCPSVKGSDSFASKLSHLKLFFNYWFIWCINSWRVYCCMFEDYIHSHSVAVLHFSVYLLYLSLCYVSWWCLMLYAFSTPTVSWQIRQTTMFLIGNNKYSSFHFCCNMRPLSSILSSLVVGDFGFDVVGLLSFKL